MELEDLKEIVIALENKIESLETTIRNSRKIEGQSESLGELFAALSKSQGEMPSPVLNKINTFHKSKYADLTAILNAAKKTLAENGLCIMQLIQCNVDGSFLITRLAHVSGQWVESKTKIISKDNSPQAIGAALTYFKRYSLASMLGLAADEIDDDGEAAEGRQTPVEEIREIKTAINGSKITAAQLIELENLLGDDHRMMGNILSFNKVDKLGDLSQAQYPHVIKFIKKAKERS